MEETEARLKALQENKETLFNLRSHTVCMEAPLNPMNYIDTIEAPYDPMSYFETNANPSYDFLPLKYQPWSMRIRLSNS